MPVSIDPNAISGLLDPLIRKREQEQLGAYTGAAFKALQAEDYPAMAAALQNIAGENPALATSLMTQAHYAQQLKQAEKLRREELNKPQMHFTDMGIVTYSPGTNTGTLQPWVQDEHNNWVLGTPQPIAGLGGGPKPGTAAPAPPPSPAPAATPPSAASPTGAPPAPPAAPTAAPATPAPTARPTPTPADTAALQKDPRLWRTFDSEFGDGAAAAVLGAGNLPKDAYAVKPAAGPAPGAPGATPAPAPLGAGPGVIGSPIPGASPKAQREAVAHEGAKYQLALAQAREKSVLALPKAQQLLSDWIELTKLGGIGPYAGSTVGQGAYRYLPLNKRISELQGNIRQAVTELAIAGKPMQGQGAVSNFERLLVTQSMPSLDMQNPETGVRYLQNLINALQADVALGNRPVR